MFMYLVVAFVLFFPILLPPEGTLVFGSDIHRSYHYFRQFFHDAIQNGIFPWWNPHIFSGEPLIANPSLSFWYPPNWLFAVLPYRYVYSWLIVSHVVLSMVGMFWLAKKWMEPLPAWLAGLVFGMSGFFMGRIWEGHIELIAAAAWMPWVVWAFTRRGVVLAGVIFALQLFAGYQTMALFTLEAVLFFTVYLCFMTRSFHPLVRMTIAVGIGIGLAGTQVIPAREFFSQSIRTYPLPYSWAALGSYPLEYVKQFLSPFYHGGPENYYGPSPNYAEMANYVGIVPILLALIAIIFLFRKKFIISVLLLIAIFGLWVSLGKNAPLDVNHFLWKTVPVYTYIRIPARHLILLVFSLSILAGFGLACFKKRLIQLLLIGLTVADLFWFGRHFVLLKEDPSIRHNQALVSTLTRQKELVRLLPNFNVGIGTRDALDFDAPMGHRLYSASGYDPSILRKYYEFIAAANGIKDPDVQQNDVQIPPLNLQSRAVDFLNIKYVFVPSWRDSVGGESGRYRLVLEDGKRDYWRLYENKTVTPRFYLVPRLTTLPDRETIAAAIRAGNVDFQKTVLVVGATKSGGDCKSDLPPVSVSMYSPNMIRLTTSADCDSYLASSEVEYPGWSATIDGQKAEIIEGNLAFRTLFVPAGKHTIVMQYQPRIFVIGLLVSVATALACWVWVKKAGT